MEKANVCASCARAGQPMARSDTICKFGITASIAVCYIGRKRKF